MVNQWLAMIPWEKIAIAVIIFILSLLLRKIFSRYILKFISTFVTRTKNHYDDKLLKAIEKPIRALIVVIGLYAAIKIFRLTPWESRALELSFRSGLVILAASGLYQLAPVFTEISGRFRFHGDEILTKFLTRTIQFIIIALAIIVVAEEWGFNVNGFVAGLGLGGLAVALAAKDSLANLFAGFVIISGKPFSIGDWVQTPTVEGMVEDITLRSTKIRTFAQAVVTVPNADLANSAITNWTVMGKRRVYFNLRVSYRTTREQLEKCIQRIDQLLHTHSGVDQEYIVVKLADLGENGFEILHYYFTRTTAWAEYLVVKQEVYFDIIEILGEEGVEIALPSQSIYFENPLSNESEPENFEEK